MPKSNTQRVREARDKLRAQGLRPVQLWIPDTETEAFRAQVARDIATAKASETADEQELSDAWERASFEDLPPWTGPDLSKSK